MAHDRAKFRAIEMSSRDKLAQNIAEIRAQLTRGTTPRLAELPAEAEVPPGLPLLRGLAIHLQEGEWQVAVCY